MKTLTICRERFKNWNCSFDREHTHYLGMIVLENPDDKDLEALSNYSRYLDDMNQDNGDDR